MRRAIDRRWKELGASGALAARRDPDDVARRVVVADNVLPGIVRSQAYLGSHRDYIVDVGQEMLIAAPARVDVPAGSPVYVRLDPQRCRGLVQ